MSPFEILAINPSLPVVAATRAHKQNVSLVDTSIAAAAKKAGYLGVIDFAFANLSPEIKTRLKSAIELGYELRLSITQLNELVTQLKSLLPQMQERGHRLTIILVPDSFKRSDQLQSSTTSKVIDQLRTLSKKLDIRILAEVVSIQEARLVSKLSVDAVIAKGQEAAGVVGETTAFVLMQECLSQVKLPVYVWGGIGSHTAAACYAAGAAGVILDSQLLLARESNVPLILKAKMEQFDGTELQVLSLSDDGQNIAAPDKLGKAEESKIALRIYCRAMQPAVSDQSNAFVDLIGKGELKDLDAVYEAIVRHNSESDPTDWIIPLGQDIAFASSLAQKYLSVAGILHAIRNSIDEHINLCDKLKPLGPQSALAKSHGTTYPILQGAMTRVSDTAEFALEVAKAGGLPFLALALMRSTEAESLVKAAQTLLENKPWGVGILGFVPAELKAEQMAVLEKYKPPYVLIAGGRPDQAKHLEDIGIKTYLHVPSPLLLDSFIEMGSRRFIFEGKECGGHVGPRSSFVLWDTMVERLLENMSSRDASSYHVIFAGGIHDARSAAAVSALAAPLAARGARIGVLMGTAYLFTQEVVNSGAIIKKFQEAAIDCDQTVLLETGPGHAIRCINSPYKNSFNQKRHNLASAGTSREEIREELELMNLGRLRLASKGLIRKDSLADLDNSSINSKDKVIAELREDTNAQSNSKPNNLEQASEQTQWQHGMYMIGQIASLHKKTMTISELHENVCQRSIELINSVSEGIAALNITQERTSTYKANSNNNEREPIAIIGMSCLLPKAKDVESYWTNILNRVDAIEEVPLYQWDWRNYYDPDPLARDKIYSKWGGFLEDIEFDPTKYGIPPSSLNSIDPMQILLLEVTDAALKDAGYDKKPFPRDKTSVILANAGHGPITAFYSLRSMLGWKLAHLDPAIKEELEQVLPEWTEDSFPGYLGNVTAGRVANRFDLGGVNFSIDAACASSLAALYTAVAELRNGNSDVVFLASTDTHNQPGDYLSFSKTHAFSADGHCKTFDTSADGIVISEGMAMLVLKRLSNAERDGDRIYAVIKGIGGSSDGRDLSLTAPRPAGQIKALNRAYDDAQVNPNTVTLIEAHGTGTVAGDKAEVEALKQVFELSKAAEQSCAIGSVKTMIGHTKATAGLASLIKVAKALHHKVLPPTIGVKNPNPACHFEQGPFYINAESRPWILPGGQSNSLDVRRAGVSAFGFGGTNFHVVLEEYTPTYVQPDDTKEDPILPAELFIFSGTSTTEVCRAITACSDKAKKLLDNGTREGLNLAALAYWQFLKDPEHQAQFGRSSNRVRLNNLGRSEQLAEHIKDSQSEQRKYCLAIVASSMTDLNDKLTRAKNDIQAANKEQIKDPRGVYFETSSFNAPNNKSKLAFLFPGQGSQYPGMLSQLTIRFAEARETFTQANKHLGSNLPKSLSDYIFPPPVFTKEEEAKLKEALTDTRIAQPAMGAANMAAYSLLTSFAVQPDMVAGHSYGEYVALCAAGYYDFASLMNVSQQRGEILAQSVNGQISRGAMAAVSCSVDKLKEHLTELPTGISIANVNSPGQTVIAGPLSEVEQSVSILQDKNLIARIIPVSQAFHTKSMKHAAEKLETVLNEIDRFDGSIDVYSNLQGQKYDRSSSKLASKLSSHTTEPVDFVSQIKKMYGDGARIFLEVGPGNVLTNLAQSILEGSDSTCIALDRPGRDGIVSLLQALAQLAVCGIKLDFQRLYQFRLAALRQVINYEPAASNKKLIYSVNSVTIQPKGKAAEMQAIKSLPAAVSKSSPLNYAPKTNLELNNLNKGFGNLKIENTPQRNNPGINQTPNRNKPNGTQTGNGQVDNIMLQFQQSMQQMANSFMETQQRVMLAYLANQKGEGYANNLSPSVMSSLTEKADFSVDNMVLPPEATTDVSANNFAANTANNGEALAAVPTTSTVSPEPELDTEQLITTLLEIVADRTGYPVDMIDPSLDLEADLGIDSIKRVEILNKFRRVLPDAKQKQLESGIEELAGARTLQGIIDWLRASHDHNPALVQSVGENNGSHKEQASALYVNGEGRSQGNGKHDNTKEGSNGHHNVVKRGLVMPVSLSPLAFTDAQMTERVNASKNGADLVLITCDKLGLADSLAKRFASHGFVPVVLKQLESKTDTKKSTSAHTDSKVIQREIDWQDFAQVEACLLDLQAKYGQASMLFHLQSFAEEKAESNRVSAVALLHLLKCFSLNATKVVSGNKPIFVSATSMGGKFGHDLVNPNHFSPTQAAIPGLIKVAAKEMADRSYKTIDFDLNKTGDGQKFSSQDLQDISLQLIKEVLANDDIVEVGYRANQRWGLEITDGSLKVDFSHPPLDKNSVVLITGGARGITAEIATQLAKHYKPILVLVGRSPLPTGLEEGRYSGIKGMRELKAKIIEALKEEGKSVNIPEVEMRYQALIKEREIRENIARLQNSANKVEYHSLDVRDAKALTSLVDRVYKDYGKIDAVIHGAGVIEDALIKDKDKESFTRVYDTKVNSALTLLEALKLESLQYLFFFSSVVGRTGNAGQVDYVAANEVLNKLALSVRDRMPKGRAAAIMWGPWKGGMAHPELEDVFAQYGWAMIDLQKGCEAFIDEMFCSNKKESEVLLVARAESKSKIKGLGARLANSEVITHSAGDKEYIVNLDTQVDTFLLDHAFDGVPVLPMSYALELMCEAAQATYHDLPLRSIEQFDIPAGILFDVPKKKISIIVNEEERQSDTATAMVSILSGAKRRVNFKARFCLGENTKLNAKIVAPTKIPLLEHEASNSNGTNGHNGNNGVNGNNGNESHAGKEIDLGKYDLGAPITLPAIADIYKQWLFHGKSFHGMKEIYSVGEKGILGQVSGLSPEKCLHMDTNGNWIIDPVMFDCSMQLGGIWARKSLDITALPTGFSRLSFFAPLTFESDELCFVHIIISPESSQNELRCDMAIYGPSGDLYIYVENLSGVGSKSLHRLANQNATIVEASISG